MNRATALPEERPFAESVPVIAGVIWLIGLMVMIVLLLYQCIGVYRRTKRSSVVADQSLLKIFWDACNECGIRRRIPLLVTTELESPLVFGLFRPKVILPQRTVDRLSLEELRAVLFHELCHLKRFDLWLNWLQAVLLTFYWFHPLVWLTASRLRSLREAIVDDLVIHHLKGKVETYGSSLLNVLKGSINRHLVAPGYVGIAETGAGLQKRVQRILDERRLLRLKIGVVASVLIAIAALIFIPQGKTQSPSTSRIASEETHMMEQGKPEQNAPEQHREAHMDTGNGSSDTKEQDNGPAKAAGTVTLNGQEYRFEWLSPQQLFGVEVIVDGEERYDEACQALWGPLRSAGKPIPYREHVLPLYNLQEDIGPLTPPEGDRYGAMWFELGRGLAGKVDRFALMAFADGGLAGSIRFFPKTLTLPRWGGWGEQNHRREWSDDILWIGSAYVDPQGMQDGLDLELIRQVVTIAKGAGFAKVQAIGWSDVPVYAMWGQAFRKSVFRKSGFTPIATIPGFTDGLFDMLAGAHGEEEREWSRSEIGSGQALDTAHQGAVLELLLNDKASVAEAQIEGIVGETLLHTAARIASKWPESIRTLEWLLERGATVDVRSRDGRTPLQIADSDAAKSILQRHGAAKQQDMENSGGKVLIEGVPELAWGKGKDNTFAGALEAAMAVTDHPYSYSDIMGLTGIAFRVRWNRWHDEPYWDHNVAIGEMPDEISAVQRLTGWTLPQEWQFGQTEPDMKKIVSNVVSSVDAGRPVVVYGSRMDVAVVIGYEGGGERLLLHEYNETGRPFVLPGEKLGPMQTYLGEHRGGLSFGDAVVEALSVAAANWRRLRGDGGVPGRDYWYGNSAFKNWIKDIAAADSYPESEDQHDASQLSNVNVFALISLYDARRAAVRFLEERASIFKGDTSELLQRAARIYQQEVNLLRPAAEQKLRFLGDYSEASFKAWTPDARKREIDVLAKARDLEEQAVAAIEKALSSLN